MRERKLNRMEEILQLREKERRKTTREGEKENMRSYFPNPRERK